MNKTLRKVICMLVSIVMLFSLVTACGSQTEPEAEKTAAGTGEANGTSNEPETIKFYIGDTWNASIIDPSWSDNVARKLTEKTGIKFEVTMTKAQDAEAEMNIMMASNELPDYIYKTGPSRTQLISGGYVEPMDELIDKYGPNIKKNIGFALNNWKEEDGKIYGLGNCIWNDPTYALSLQINTLYMRYDILKELGYAKLERKNEMDSFITIDEYLEILKQVKQKYPEMIPSLFQMTQAPFESQAYELLLRAKGSVLNGSNGGSLRSIYEDGKAKYFYDSKYTMEILKFLNKFYNDGYVPKDIAVMKQEQKQSLISTGKVFSSFGMVQGLSEAQEPLAEGNDERRMVMFYLTDNSSIKNILINSAYVIGMPGNMISAKSKHKEKLMKFFDYCASDEGSLLICAGVEGETYTKDASGNLTPVEEVAKGYASWDANMIKKFGIGNWFNTFPVLAGLRSDGHANEINAELTFSKNKWVVYNNKDMKHFAYPTIISSAGDLSKEKQPDGFNAFAKINSYINDLAVNAIMAKDEGQCQAEWEKAIARMKADGLDTLNECIDQDWKKLADVLGRSPDKLNEVGAFK